jgi:hypothetical protein
MFVLKKIGFYIGFIFMLMSAGNGFSQDNTNFTKLNIDNVSFDEKSFMTIYVYSNDVVAYYDRFENKSYKVKSARIYNKKNKLKYTLVPLSDVSGVTIHIKNDLNQRGKITIAPKVDIGKVSFNITVDFFNQSYKLEKIMNMNPPSIEMKYNLKKADQVVLTSSTKIASGSQTENTGILIDKTMLESPDVAACWSIILLLLNEIDMDNGK